jgi:hypothetical protein
LRAEGKQKGQKGQKGTRRAFLSLIAIFAFLASPTALQKTNPEGILAH